MKTIHPQQSSKGGLKRPWSRLSVARPPHNEGSVPQNCAAEEAASRRGFSGRAPSSPGRHQPWRSLACALGLLAAALLPAGCVAPASDLSSTAGKAPEGPLRLDIGDVLQVNFPGQTNLNTTATLRRDGSLTLPLVGVYHAEGKTLAEAQKDIAKLYEPQLQFKEVVVSLASSYWVVYVGGAVLKPGKVTSDRPLTVLEAIMEAGGFDEGRANKKRVVVIRHRGPERLRFVLNLQNVLAGKERSPFYLRAYDIVYVPERVQVF